MSILDDPFFRDKAKSGRWYMRPQTYAAWKRRITPQTPYGQPNLFIIGTTHNSLTISRSGTSVNFLFDVQWGEDIGQKYNNKELGLNPESRSYFIANTVRPGLAKKYAALLGGTVK